MKNRIFPSIIILAAAIIAMSMTLAPDKQVKPWPVPEKYDKMENPVKFDKKAATAIWSKHCKSCHGKEGLGDGSKAEQLDTPCGDFTTEEFQAQSDGAMFYKTVEGRDDMPGFSKKIPDEEDVWQLVHLMRTFE